MSHRISLLDDYNRNMRRRLGRESLMEKLDAIRHGGGFRPGQSSGQQQSNMTANSAPNDNAPVQLGLFD